jgi:argininosuccinate lyase
VQSINPLFGDDVTDTWDYNMSAEKRDTEGGVSKRSVLEQVAKMRAYMAAEVAAMPELAK